MTDIFLLFLWLQAASGLLQSGVLLGLYLHVYREKFLKYWCLANVYGVLSLAVVIVVFGYAPGTAWDAHTMQFLVLPQLILLGMAAMSMGTHELSAGQKKLLTVMSVGFLGMQAVTGLLAVDMAQLVTELRVERLAASAGVVVWFCVVLWRKYPQARTLGGRVTTLFLGLQAIHYLLLAITVAGLPVYVRSNSIAAGIVGATLPVCTAAGLFLLALESAAGANRAVRESEERYRILLRTSPDAFLLTDSTGNIAMCNQRAMELFGCASEQDLIGTPARSLVAPAQETDLTQQLAASLRGGVARDVECLLLKKDGTVFPGAVSAALVPWGENHSGVWTILARDISQRRHAEERIRLLAHALRSASDCIVICDTSDHILYANDAFLRTYEYTERELMGRHIAILRAPLNSEDVLTGLLPATLREGWRGELWNRSKTGRVFPISLATSVVRDERGDPVATVGVSRDETEAKKAEMSLRESERRFRDLLESVQMMALILGRGGAITFCNDYLLATTGWTREEMIGQPFYQFVPPEGRAEALDMVETSLAGGETIPFAEGKLLAKSGRPRVIQWNNTVLRDHDAMPVGFACLGVDVTAHRDLQEQYLRAQKLESLGRMAGGVAHDFNNLLTVINGYSALLRSRTPETDPRRRQLDEIGKAGERAIGLVQQLLTFSRRQVTQPQVLRLNAVVAEAETMLRRLVGDNIELIVKLEARPDEVMADTSQLHQVLMNLAVNARDAMPQGGKLAIETSNSDVRARDVVEDADAARGAYVQLSATDSGTGMDAETREHIFEPFFTTKDPGKGTGLGLATVYGIVRQSGGFIRVDSAPGEGAAFHVFLPQAAVAVADQPSNPMPEGLEGSETVLIAEDDESVRVLAAEVLTGYGYKVLLATDGLEALEIVEGRGEPVDVLLTDVMMPGLDGKTLAERLRASRPRLKAILMSGCADEVTKEPGAADVGMAYLPKPFPPQDLAAKVRDLLAAPAAPHSILVVDDEEAVRLLLRDLLAERYRVLLAADGLEALETIAGDPNLDLVITDLVMPNLEGIETIQAIRKANPRLRIVAMSGAFGGHFLKSAKALGADATLMKPIHVGALYETLGELLKRGDLKADQSQA
jgi:PAS domain S-box-containing protein